MSEIFLGNPNQTIVRWLKRRKLLVLTLTDDTAKDIQYVDSELTLDKIQMIDGSVTSGNLKSVNQLPTNVTSIGANAFSGCANLQSIEIPDSVTSIGEFAFSNCSKLTSIALPEGITTISYATFSNCGLTSITIPSAVHDIGDQAFEHCKMAHVMIPSSVKSIGWWAFSSCSNLMSFEVDPNNTQFVSANGCLCSKDMKTLYFGTNGNVTIPFGIICIDRSAFGSYRNLTSVEIPTSVEVIGEQAFAYCDRLTSVTIPYSVTTIERDVFAYCDSIAKVTFEEKTIDQIKSMDNYPWGLDENVIVPGVN